MNEKQRLEQLEKILDALKPREAKTEFEGRLVELLDEFIFNKSNIRNDADSPINNKRVKNDYIDALIKLYKEGI